MILFGSILNSLPWNIWLSIIAHIKLLALVIAWKSPVKCKLISSEGTIDALPPPHAPPLIPNTGPNEGSLSTHTDFFLSFLNASLIPIDIVVFPSPYGVGLILVTSTNLPLLFVGILSILAI